MPPPKRTSFTPLLTTLAIITCLLSPSARAAVITFNDMKVVAGVTAAQTADGIRIASIQRREGKLQTARTFQTPLVIKAVAKTNNTNLRLYFGDKGMIIFNWEANKNELRHHGPRTGEQHAVQARATFPLIHLGHRHLDH